VTPEERGELLKKFLAAIEREQQLRTAAGSPGSAHFDLALWQEYLAALDATTEASREYQQSIR
jgi:hypothetical protein